MISPARSRIQMAVWPILAVGALSAALAACGGSSSKASTAPTTAPATASPTTVSPAAGGGSPASYTVSAAKVGAFGTVLVNGEGRTLYLLTSEKGGTFTCTAANGCTAYWPPVQLPSGVTGAIAGSGVQSSLLGTAKDAAGDVYVTYGGYPLYSFTGDSAAGAAHGEGVKSFGGSWWVVSPAGMAVTASSASTGSSPTTAKSGSGSGYGY